MTTPDGEVYFAPYVCAAACSDDEACPGVLGQGACCRQVEDIAGLSVRVCLEAARCCRNCGELCCPNGTVCAADQRVCLPADAVQCPEGLLCGPGSVCTASGCCPTELPVDCPNGCCPPRSTCDPTSGSCIAPTSQPCPGAGRWCRPDEDCLDDPLGDGQHCVPYGSEVCDDGHVCPLGQSCNGDGCCPLGRPNRCGQTCCPVGYACSADGLSCIPPGAADCGHGRWCPAGQRCTDDRNSCVPDGVDVCGPGRWCRTGEVCAGSGCCPADRPVPCGASCCPAGDSCSADGNTCIPPGGKDCGHGNWCPAGELCSADGVTCYPVGGDDCGRGRTCAPGLSCTLTGCCNVADPVFCGDDCCPRGYRCEAGQCLYPGGVPCDGSWCPPGSICTPDGHCIPAGATDCGLGYTCQAGLVCVDGGNLCCPPNATTSCGGQCCPDAFECSYFDKIPLCVPAGAVRCDEANWCPEGTRCGEGNSCVPDGADDCGGGQWCPVGSVCTPGGPEGCCPEGSTSTCEGRCCPDGWGCAPGGRCVEPGMAVCPDGSLCGAGQLCHASGGCCQFDRVCGDQCCAVGTYCEQSFTAATFCVPIGDVMCRPELTCHPGTHCSEDGRQCEADGCRGQTNRFWATDLLSSRFYQVNATCLTLGTHASWWVDFELRNTISDQLVNELASEFDQVIHPGVTGAFGPEPSPGVDGDSRLVVLLMDILPNVDGYFFGGYFHPLNVSDDPHSNQADMFYMDIDEGSPVGEDAQLRFYSTLAHEFQHMIHYEAKPSDEVWTNEGFSEQAPRACGYEDFQGRGGYFLGRPSDSLTRWDGKLEDYAVVYAFFTYLADQYGGRGPLFLDINRSPARGIAGVEAGLAAVGAPRSFGEVFLDWTLANVLGEPNSPYGYTSLDPDGLAIADGVRGGLPALGPWAAGYHRYNGPFTWDSGGPCNQAAAVVWDGAGQRQVLTSLTSGQQIPVGRRAVLVPRNACADGDHGQGRVASVSGPPSPRLGLQRAPLFARRRQPPRSLCAQPALELSTRARAGRANPLIAR